MTGGVDELIEHDRQRATFQLLGILRKHNLPRATLAIFADGVHAVVYHVGAQCSNVVTSFFKRAQHRVGRFKLSGRIHGARRGDRGRRTTRRLCHFLLRGNFIFFLRACSYGTCTCGACILNGRRGARGNTKRDTRKHADPHHNFT